MSSDRMYPSGGVWAQSGPDSVRSIYLPYLIPTFLTNSLNRKVQHLNLDLLYINKQVPVFWGHFLPHQSTLLLHIYNTPPNPWPSSPITSFHHHCPRVLRPVPPPLTPSSPDHYPTPFPPYSPPHIITIPLLHTK